MGIKNMQGTSAFIEYIKTDDEFRRDKRYCEFYRKDGLCTCPKNGTYLCKCYTARHCRYYRDKRSTSNNSTNKNQSKQVSKIKEILYSNKISKSCRVTLQDYQLDERIQIILVDPQESDPFNNKISIKSPLGAALINKDKGDKIVVIVGEKKQYYKILSWDKQKLMKKQSAVKEVMNANSNQHQNNKSLIIDKKDDFKYHENSEQIVKEVTLIKNKDVNCPYHKDPIKLVRKNVNLAYYKNKRKKSIERTIPATLLYCTRCNTYYITQDIKNILKEQENIETKRLNVRAKDPDLSVHKKDKTLVAQRTSNLESNSIRNSQSKLGELGYSTTKSDEERWNIITNRALKQMSAKEIIKFLKYLVDERKRQKDGPYKYRNAIARWERDIQKLEAQL